MDGALTQVVRSAAWWWVVGGCLGFAGACWPPYRQWSAPLEEGLRVIQSHPVGWSIIHAGFVTGIWMLVVGTALQAYALRASAGGSLALLAAILLAFAALAWTTNIAYRLSVTVWAAGELVTRGAVPQEYADWKRFASYLFAGFSVLSYLSVAASGGVVLQSQLAPRALGWVLVAWGLSLGFVVGANVPAIAYVPFIVLGSFVLRAG
jgi:hypothetical protein